MPLFNLPIELLQNIAQYLPYTSLVALRWSCSYLYSILDGQPPPRWAHIMPSCKSFLDAHRRHFTDLRPSPFLRDDDGGAEARAQEAVPENRSPDDLILCGIDLLILETWSCFNRHIHDSTLLDESVSPFASSPASQTLYACTECLKLLPRSAFTPAQTRGRHAKFTQPAWESATGALVMKHRATTVKNYRFCISCGVKKGQYVKGTLLQFTIEPSATDNGSGEHVEKTRTGTGIVCKRCGEFKVTGADTKAGLRRMCSECLAYRPP